MSEVPDEGGAALKVDLSETTIHNFPHAFISKRAEPILIKTLDDKRRPQLYEMYLSFRPRASFSGLPPATDRACVAWVEGMIAAGVNLVALSFEQGVAGHAVLFPIDASGCEMLCVVSPPQQKVGIGTELTRCASQLACELGFDAIRLNVEAGNHVARHVYEKCGFHYLSRGLRDELDMSLDLRRCLSPSRIAVGDIMNTSVVAVGQATSCREALATFLANGVATLPVVNDRNEVVGILSETDLLVEANITKKVAEVLTRDVVSVQEDCSLAKVISLFRSRKLRCIPVLDARGRLTGVVGRRDVLAHYAGQLEPPPAAAEQ